MIPNKPPKEFRAKGIVTPGGIAKAYALWCWWVGFAAVMLVVGIIVNAVVQSILEVSFGPLDDAKVGSATVLGLFVAGYIWFVRGRFGRARYSSRNGKGSRFSVTVPTAAPRAEIAELPVPPAAVDVTGKLIIVIDDDALVLDSMGGLLSKWGCRVVAAATSDEALVDLGPEDRPDLIICDYRLANGRSGIAAIADLRKVYGAAVPAFLISGHIAPDRLRIARESGHHLLHKPLRAMALRAMINRLLKSSSVAGAA